MSLRIQRLSGTVLRLYSFYLIQLRNYFDSLFHFYSFYHFTDRVLLFNPVLPDFFKCVKLVRSCIERFGVSHSSFIQIGRLNLEIVLTYTIISIDVEGICLYSGAGEWVLYFFMGLKVKILQMVFVESGIVMTSWGDKTVKMVIGSWQWNIQKLHSQIYVNLLTIIEKYRILLIGK